jgi:hypothetical protein
MNTEKIAEQALIIKRLEEAEKTICEKWSTN